METCDWLKSQVSAQFAEQAYERTLNTIALAQECYGESNVAAQVWLLEYLALTLDVVERYDEYEAAVESFFADETLWAAASDRAKANFYMGRLRYLSLKGDLYRATIAYQEGRPYHETVRDTDRLNFELNASHLYIKVAAYDEAERVIERVWSEASALGLTWVVARAEVQRGELLLYRALRNRATEPAVFLAAAETLHEGYARYAALSDQQYGSDALATYGFALGMAGERAQGHAALGEAINKAESSQNTNVHIYALLRRSQLHLAADDLAEAETDVQTALALADASGLSEYSLQLFETLGQIYEQQTRPSEALAAYRQAVTAANGTPYPLQEWELTQTVRRAEASLIRLEVGGEQGSGHAIAWMVALLIGLVLGFNAQRLLRRSLGDGTAPLAQGARVVQPAQPEFRTVQPTLHAPTPRTAPPSLFDERLHYIFTVLTDPDQVLDCTEDPYLIERIQKRDIQLRSVLYACAAALECRAKGTVFENDPANTIGSYLRKWFKKYNLTYPADVYGWRQFFAEQDQDTHPFGK